MPSFTAKERKELPDTVPSKMAIPSFALFDLEIPALYLDRLLI